MQQRTDCEDSGSATAGSQPTRTAPRFARDRELMRKSALLRRMWGRAPPCCRCCPLEQVARHSRSLDGSQCELRPESRGAHADLSASTYRSHAYRTTADALVPPLSADLSLPSASPAYGGARTPRSLHTATDPASLRTAVSETPTTCDFLEIVLTESAGPLARSRSPCSAELPASNMASVDLDQYVSSVLVESLNSLSDRLESVTCLARNVSVLEKEIKVKLRSTGVNTVVHLSPTSNNQIIFGNEELCDDVDRPGPPLAEPYDTPASGVPLMEDACSEANRAVLRQIQRLFRDELRDFGRGSATASARTPAVSHIEISNVSNVDLFFDNDVKLSKPGGGTDVNEFRPPGDPELEVLSGIGAEHYHEAGERSVPVPRYTALPHTASMEVNASSSDEVGFVGSESVSLVDSLDDPTSPRVPLPHPLSRRPDLSRSAVDVVDLLPETEPDDDQSAQKSETFFVRIEDGDCVFETENVNVADRLPDEIKRRLHRRHRRRQLRSESARRDRDKVVQREKQRRKRDVERDCVALVRALIDDVVAKIAQDELKCARIERRPVRSTATTTMPNELPEKNRKKQSHPLGVGPKFVTDHHAQTSGDGNSPRMQQVRGKLSLMTRPALNRLYRESEIRDGKDRIEILEILEYVNVDQHTPVATAKSGRKSRIPVPVHEKFQRSPGKFFVSSLDDSTVPIEPHCALGEFALARRGSEGDAQNESDSKPSRRASLPPVLEPRPRSGSIRFQRVFDVIPEERSSLSLESPADDTTCLVPTVPSVAKRSIATSPLRRPGSTSSPLRVKGGEAGGGRACDGRTRALYNEGTVRSCAPPLLHHRTASSVSVE